MDHVEEKEFTLRVEVRCVFPADYDGDADGFAWAEALPALTAEIVRAASAAASRAGFSVRTGNRGRPSDEEVTLILERREPGG
jgi:hypothetical protein